ncbi:MAG: hypothetical protein ACXADB_08995 [Candidatus Hermodarchaeia archaeon]|jgi:hypothetical protein
MKRTKFLVVVFRVLLVVAFLFSTTGLLPQGSIARMISPDCQILAETDYGESGGWIDEPDYKGEDEGDLMDEEPEGIPDTETDDESWTDAPPLEEEEEEVAPGDHEGDDMI